MCRQDTRNQKIMKFLLLFVLVAVALSAQEPDEAQNHLAKSFARILRMDPKDSLKCIKKSEVTIGDMRYMEDTINLSETEITDMIRVRKASCAVACCAQKLGVMVEGEVQEEKLYQRLQKSGMPEEVEMTLRNAVRSCKEQVTDTSDECMVVYKLLKCVYTKTETAEEHK